MKTSFKLLKAAKKYWAYLLFAFFAMTIASVAQVFAPVVIRQFLDHIATSPDDLIRTAYYYAGIYLVLALLQAVGTFVKSYAAHIAAWNFINDLRIALYDHIQNLSLKFYHDKQTGQLMSRIMSDTREIEVFIAHAAPELLGNLVLLIGVTIMLFLINAYLAIAALSLMPFIFLIALFHSKKVRPIFRRAHQKTAELSAVLHDNISGIREIQAFNRQEHATEQVEEVSEKDVALRLNALKKSSLSNQTISLFNQIGTVMVIIIGGIFVQKYGMPSADIVAFVLYLNIFYQPINNFSRLNEDLQNSITASERVFEIFDEISDVEEKEDAVEIGRAKGCIEFLNVGFSYRDGVNVLQNINLKINMGETVALVGATGAGKTTMASLVARFYDPTNGQVLMDGVDLKELTISSLRDNMSIVLQDVFLFNGTVAENIAYGAEGASREEILRAAEIANAHEFIERMENGYDSIIGERGIKLSGGQKQRLSIARAVLRDRPILILDEATASVDTATERMIQEAIDKVSQNRTTIIIAHRLSTIQNADKIAVIDNGQIVELGNHTELMAQNGIYRGLYNES